MNARASRLVSVPPRVTPAGLGAGRPSMQHRSGKGWPQPSASASWPRVSLHLPLQDGAASVACATLDSLAALDYPALDVLVVDTSVSPAAWEPVAEHCARLGPRFRFFHLGPRVGQHAAALNFALQETSPAVEVIGTLEAGCAVHTAWLRRTAPLMLRPGLGFVQGAWMRPAPEAPLIQHLAAASRPEALPAPAVRLCPSLGLIRAEALRLAGGWVEDAPDHHAELGLRLQRQGWEAVQMIEPLGRSPLPPDVPAWRAAQAEAARSALDLLWRHGDVLLNPFHRSLSAAQRRQLLRDLLPGAVDLSWLLASCLTLVASLLLLPVRDAAILPALPTLLLALALVGGRGAASLATARPGTRHLALLAGLAAMPVRGMTLARSLLGRPLPSAGRLARLPLPLMQVGAIALSLTLCGAAALPWALTLGILALPSFASLLLDRLPQGTTPASRDRRGNLPLHLFSRSLS